MAEPLAIKVLRNRLNHTHNGLSGQPTAIVAIPPAPLQQLTPQQTAPTASTFPPATAPTPPPAAPPIPPAIPTAAPLVVPTAAPLATPIAAPPATLITAPATPPGPQSSNYNQLL